jgi:hypothetical protein
VVVITDGAVTIPDAMRAVSLRDSVLSVGEPVDSTGIIRIDVRRGRDPVTRRPQVQAFAQVAHFGATPREVFVTLRPRNVEQPLASRRLALAPGERAPVVLTYEPAPTDAGMGLVFEISPPDAFPADDRAFARVPPASSSRSWRRPRRRTPGSSAPSPRIPS